jgi:hypothetical protein
MSFWMPVLDNFGIQNTVLYIPVCVSTLLDIMTSILYIIVMNNKLNIPEEVDPRTRDFSIAAQWRVNHWAFLAIGLSVAGDLLARRQGSLDLPAAARAIIAISPLLPAILYIGSLKRWLDGMDELHRQIIMRVCLFAVAATFYLDMSVYSLREWGLLPDVLSPVTWRSWWMQAIPLTIFYMLGTIIFNRRYK